MVRDVCSFITPNTRKIGEFFKVTPKVAPDGLWSG